VFPPPPARTEAPPPNEHGIARIASPVLHLDHYVETTAVIDNQMQAPVDASYAVGYYADFKVRPGESGNAIFSAHETWEHMQAPFFTLHLAERGDDIYVSMTDGRRFHYRIINKKRYEADSMPMGEILDPPQRPFGKAWITLITCGGRIVYDHTGFGEYLDRDVVVAELVG
jgi:sortase (surface protein transpeptidase)